MLPTIGRTVLFTINESHARAINSARTQAGIATKTGNTAREGDIYPMVIVKINGAGTPSSSVNGQLTLDGNDSYWVTSVYEGEADSHGAEYGKWHWPVIK